MKKLLAILLILILMFAIFGCSQSNPTAECSKCNNYTDVQSCTKFIGPI